ncbi:MAG TPA: hypothetical protein VGJ30_19010 [Candidatus Angelobacter sp.]
MEDAVDAVKYFPHGCCQGYHFELAVSQEMAVVSAEVGVAPDRHQGRPKQSVSVVVHSADGQRVHSVSFKDASHIGP